SELARIQWTVSALKSSDVRARNPVRASMRAASSLGAMPDAAVTSTNVSRRRSGRRMRKRIGESRVHQRARRIPRQAFGAGYNGHAAIVDQKIITSRQGPRRNVKSRRTAEPLIDQPSRGLQLASGATRIDDYGIGIAQNDGCHAVLEGRQACQSRVINANDLERLKPAIWKANAGRPKRERHRSRDAFNTAHTVKRRRGQVSGRLDRSDGWVHDPDIRSRVLCNKGESAGYETGKVRTSKGDEKRREGNSEKETGILDPVAHQHLHSHA